ncbi:hypothetical protein C9J45_12675 [Photobacterium sp. GB-1]|nr:hypothetical protein C9J45_12675 [Photobacterium sp. GB-1]
MVMTKLIFFLIFILSGISIYSFVMLSVYIGFLMKKYDKGSYDSLYIMCIPVSPALIFGYMFNNKVISMYPQNKRWIFFFSRVLILISMIGFVMTLLGAYLFS